MRPIKFELSDTIHESAKEICSRIADVSLWSDFTGYAILPGIHSAEFEIRTADMIGSSIRVINTDGSNHVEEIIEWDEGQKVVIKLHDFSTPLNRLSTHFIEEWLFEKIDHRKTHVNRRFQLFPSRKIARPILWCISILLKRAIRKHIDKIKAMTKNL